MPKNIGDFSTYFNNFLVKINGEMGNISFTIPKEEKIAVLIKCNFHKVFTYKLNFWQ